MPEEILPINYNLDMKVFFDPRTSENAPPLNEMFSGRALITMRVVKPTRFIIFHCDLELEISDTIEITNLATNTILTVRDDQHEYDENQFYMITLDVELAIGEYLMKLDYQGDFGLATNLVGFYKSRYNEDGIIKYKLK